MKVVGPEQQFPDLADVFSSPSSIYSDLFNFQISTESYVFWSSPGESDKPDVRFGIFLSLDGLCCPFQDQGPSLLWKTAKSNRISSIWAPCQLKPERRALRVLEAVYLEIGVDLLFCIWTLKHDWYTHMYVNTGNISINRRWLSIWGLENAINAISLKEPLFQPFRKHHMWWILFWRNISTYIIIEQKAMGCILLLICFTWKQLEHWALAYIPFSGNKFNWEPNSTKLCNLDKKSD